MSAWSLDIDGVKRKTSVMSPEERLLTQLGIYTQLSMLANGLGHEAGIPLENTQHIQNMYDAITKAEYPELDKQVTEIRLRLKKPALPAASAAPKQQSL